MVLDTLSSLAPAMELGLEHPCSCLVPDRDTGKALKGHSSTGSRPLPPPVLACRGIALELEQGPRSLCINAGQINLRFYPSRG